jgi:hypothetical protein
MWSCAICGRRVFQALALALVFLFQPSESQQIISVDDEHRDPIDRPTPVPPPIPAPSPPNPPTKLILPILDVPGEQVDAKSESFITVGGKDPADLPSWCESFSMSEFDRDYKTDGINMEPDMWALHALQWKAYVHETVDGGSFNEGSISQDELDSQSYFLTSEDESCTVRADFLNALESRPFVYCSESGAPVDPNGSWNCVDESDLSSDNPSLEGAIIAALNMHFWNTPTYVDIFGPGLCDPPPTSCSIMRFNAKKAVLGKVTLCTKYDSSATPPPPPPTTVCGWNSASWSDLIDISDDCEDNIDLYSVTFSIFSTVEDPVTDDGYFEQDLYTSNPEAWEFIYGPAVTGFDGQSTLIFDPPAGTTNEDIHMVVEAAKKASGTRVRRKQ